MSQNLNPFVSICIPTFNGGHFVHRALESAIHQSYKNIEIIVTDDASSDKTEEVVRQYIVKDKRIKYFRNDFNVGGQKNFFRAVEFASGDYIYPLCHDDWLSKNCIEESIKKINLYPDAAAVFCDVIHLDLKDNLVFSPKSIFTLGDKNYPVGYLLKNAYKSRLGSYSGFALYRKKDLLDIKSFIFKILEDRDYIAIRDFGFWGETLISLKILSKYNYFVYSNNSAYIKVEHFNNYANQIKPPHDISKRVKLSTTIRRFYELIYKKELKKFLLHFKIDFGAREINNIFISFLKGEFIHNSLMDFIKEVLFFVRDYSLLEKVLFIMKTFLLLFIRFLEFVGRHLKKPLKNKTKFSFDYRDLFLDKSGDTTYSFSFENKKNKEI